MIKDRRIFLVILFILLFTVLAQLKLGEAVGFGYDFVLAILIVSVFFVGFPEFFVLFLLSAALLNWRPGVSLEILGLFIFPMAALVGRRLFPGKDWFLGVIFVFFGILLFYATVDFGPVFGLVSGFGRSATDLLIIWGSVLGNLLSGTFYGGAVFYFLSRFSKTGGYG